MDTLIHFFKINENPSIDVKDLNETIKIMNLYGLETNELISKYYIDRLKEQNEIKKEPYGLLTIKAFFLNNFLHLQLLNGRNLPIADKNGIISKVKTLIIYSFYA